jgi:hypothetical protein
VLAAERGAHNRYRSAKKLAAAGSFLRNVIGKEMGEDATVEAGSEVASSGGLSLVPIVIPATPVIEQGVGARGVAKVCWHSGEQ